MRLYTDLLTGAPMTGTIVLDIYAVLVLAR